MEAIIHFVIKYNEKIIYILGGAICFLSAMVVWWQVFGKKGLKDEHASNVDLSGVEETLKKILSQTNAAIGVTAAASAAPAAGAVAGAVEIKDVTGIDGKPITDLAGVKGELETRAKIIEDLRAQVKEASEQDASEELLAKIKNLESRLAEYEIIEDDIADLSVLKEENAKLKKELEQIKRGGPQMVDQFADALAEAEGKAAAGAGVAAAASAATGLAAPEAKADDMFAGALENVEPLAAAIEDMLADNKDASSGTSSVATSAGAATVADQEDLMAAAVAAAQSQVDTKKPGAEGEAIDGEVVFENRTAGVAKPPVSAATVAAAAASVSDASASAAAEAPKGDIFGEFAEGSSSDDPLAALGDIDPDKMLDELKDLNLDIEVGAEALDEAPDIDKMAQEATTLGNKKG